MVFINKKETYNSSKKLESEAHAFVAENSHIILKDNCLLVPANFELASIKSLLFMSCPSYGYIFKDKTGKEEDQRFLFPVSHGRYEYDHSCEGTDVYIAHFHEDTKKPKDL